MSAVTILVFSTRGSIFCLLTTNFIDSTSVLQFFAILQKLIGSLMIAHSFCLLESVGGLLVKAKVVSVI